MNELQEWMAAWGVPAAALPDLLQRMGVVLVPPPAGRDGSETRVQGLVRLAAHRHDEILWRNNVGVLDDKRGVPVRFGLCNDSAAVNKRIKSADLIGSRRRRITAADVGAIIGQFTSRECKREGWVWCGDDHEQAQLRWALIVQAWGGDARFVTDPEQLA